MDRPPTEQRLLLAAEKLFATHGIDGASLRAIMQEAETNVAAVHYHFGSKEGLLDAVVRSRMHDVLFARDRLVAELTIPADPIDMARALIEPVLDLVDRGGADWAAVIAELLRVNHPALAAVSDGFGDRNSRFAELIGSLDPGAGDHDRAFRLVQAVSVTLITLGNLSTFVAVLSREELAWSEDDVRDQLVRTVAAILRGV